LLMVRVIDNFYKNRNMGSLIEAKVGTGKLILCTMDIHTDIEKRIAARQLRSSRHYAPIDLIHKL
jgi:hypothetical protein